MRALRILLPLLLAQVVLLGTMLTPAHATDELGLSQDGVTWSESLTRPLFDPDIRWVPGDVRIARFFVRNQDRRRGDLTVDVARTTRDTLLETGSLEISARAAGRPWTSVTTGGLQRLLTTDDLLSAEPVAVDVRVTLDRLAPNGTMVLATDLDFAITLTESLDGQPAVGGDLPDTGAIVPSWLLPLALLLLATGAALVVRRRRGPDDIPLDPHLETP